MSNSSKKSKKYEDPNKAKKDDKFIEKKESTNSTEKVEETVTKPSEIRKIFRFGIAYLLFIVYLYSIPSFITVPEELLNYRGVIITYTLLPFGVLLFIRLRTFDLVVSLIRYLFKNLGVKILLQAIAYVEKEKALVKAYLTRVFMSIYILYVLKLVFGVYLGGLLYSVLILIFTILIVFDTMYTFKLVEKIPSSYLYAIISKYVLLTVIFSPLFISLAVIWPLVTYSVSRALIIGNIFTMSVSYNITGLLFIGIFLFVLFAYVILFLKYPTTKITELKSLYEAFFVIANFVTLDFVILATNSFAYLAEVFVSLAQYVPISLLLVLFPLLLLEYVDRMQEIFKLLLLLIFSTIILGVTTLNGYIIILGLFSIFAVLVYYLHEIGLMYFVSLLAISVADFIFSYFLSGGGIILLSAHLVLYQAGIYILSITGIMLSLVEKRVTTIMKLPETYQQELKKVATTPLESYIFSIKLRIPDVEERLAGKFVVSSAGTMIFRYMFRLAILSFLVEIIVLFPYLIMYINPWYSQLVIMNSPEITIMPFLLLVILLILTLRMKKEKFEEVNKNESTSERKGKKK